MPYPAVVFPAKNITVVPFFIMAYFPYVAVGKPMRFCMTDITVRLDLFVLQLCSFNMVELSAALALVNTAFLSCLRARNTDDAYAK
jgi:hypothetical protein